METISLAIRTFRDESMEPAAGVDLRKMIKFLCDQMLAAGYSDLN
jgi:hypothetical protein